MLLRAQEAAIGAVKPGQKLCDVYKSATAVVEKEAPELLPHLTKNAGAGIGIGASGTGIGIGATGGVRAQGTRCSNGRPKPSFFIRLVVYPCKSALCF